MKIALSFPGCYRRGGVERVMLECANYLSNRGHDTHVYSAEWEEDALAASIKRHGIDAPRKPLLVRSLIHTLKANRAISLERPLFDVVGGFGVETPPNGVVWVQSVHRSWLNVSRRQRNFVGRLKQSINPNHPVLLASEWQYFHRRRYGKVIALSDRVKEDLQSHYRVPARDIVVLPNGFQPAEFHPEKAIANRSQIRESYGYKPNDKVILFVANELMRKGFFPLLRALQLINDPSVHLLAVGRLDPGMAQRDIDALGVQHQVRFTGPSNDVAPYYGAADLFALPTQYEPWGLVIVEALACGLPVVTSRIAGAAQAVREGESGMLLNDPNDVKEIAEKLKWGIQCSTDKDREEIASTVQSYSWPEVLKEYERILHSVASPDAKNAATTSIEMGKPASRPPSWAER